MGAGDPDRREYASREGDLKGNEEGGESGLQYIFSLSRYIQCISLRSLRAVCTYCAS